MTNKTSDCKKTMKKLLLIPIVLSLVGCATSQVPLDKAVTVQPVAFVEPSAVNNVKVTIVRDSGFSGSACAFNLYYKDKLVARLNTSEKATFYVPASEANISVDSCLKLTDDGTFIYPKENDSIQMRTGMSAAGDIYIRRVK